MAEYAIVADGKCIIVMSKDGLRFLELPSIRDCHISHLIEKLNSLPHDVCFLCDLNIDHVRDS